MPLIPPVRPAIASGLRKAAEKAPAALQKPLNGAASKLEKAVAEGAEKAKKVTLRDYAKDHKLKAALILGGVGFGYYQSFKSGEASGAAGQLSAAQEEALKSLTAESQEPQAAPNLGWNETPLAEAPAFDASQLGAYGIDPNTLAALAAQGGLPPGLEMSALGGAPAGLGAGAQGGLPAGLDMSALGGAAGLDASVLSGAAPAGSAPATAGAGFDPAGVQALLGNGQ